MDSKKVLKSIIYQMVIRNLFFDNNDGTITTESALIIPTIILVVYILIEFSLMLYGLAIKEAVIYREMEKSSVQIAYDSSIRGLYMFNKGAKNESIKKLEEVLLKKLDERDSGVVNIDKILIKATKVSGSINLQSRLGTMVSMGNREIDINKQIYKPCEAIRNIELMQDYVHRYTNLSERTSELFKSIKLLTDIGESDG